MTVLRRASSLKPRILGGTLSLAALCIVLWLVAIDQANFSRMGELGLVSILGWPYFLGLALVVFGFTVELLRTPIRPKRILVFVVLLVVFIYGTASAAEPIAALADSWLHAGFLQYFLHHGRIKPHFMADFSWPGSYSLGSVLVTFTGQANAFAFLRWFPLFIELLYLAPLMAIVRSCGVGQRTGWLGVAIYYSVDWIDQDYFSPQALGLFFLFVVIAAVLSCWQPNIDALRRRRRPIFRRRPRSNQKPSALSRVDGRDTFSVWTTSVDHRVILASWQSESVPSITGVLSGIRTRLAQTGTSLSIRRLEGRDSVGVWSASNTLGVLGLLGIIFMAMAWSHQLTPYALILMLCACLLTRRLGRPELVIIAALAPIAWLSLGASDYWIGHLNYIFGSFGQFSNTIGSNVTSRVTGSASHRFVTNLRILSVGGLFLLAGIGALRRATNSRVLEALVVAPILLIGIQNYVGEILMRTVLLGLPFTAILAASALMPLRVGLVRPFLSSLKFGRHGRTILRASVFVVILSFAMATTVNRGGNDAYEAYSLGQLSAVNYAYDHAHSGDTIGMVVPYLPFGARYEGSVYFSSFIGGGVHPLQETLANFLKNPPPYIVLSQSQEAWGVNVAGYSKGWETTLQRQLTSTKFRVVATWPTATVLGLRPVVKKNPLPVHHRTIVGH
jgi:hypothetical protein